MEWFKHSTGSHEDPDINDIWDEFGDSGYIMFFVMLEIYGREYNNIDDDGFLWLNLKYIARKCRKSSAKVMKFLRYCEEISRFSLKISNQSSKKIGLKIPKFIEISSNWTKRKKDTPTEAPTEGTTAKEVEVEVEKKKTYGASKNEDTFDSLKEFFNNSLELGLLDKVFSAIAQTRQCNKVQESVLFNEMSKWKTRDISLIEKCMKIYLENKYYLQGKNEKYLLGIINNEKKDATIDIINPSGQELK